MALVPEPSTRHADDSIAADHPFFIFYESLFFFGVKQYLNRMMNHMLNEPEALFLNQALNRVPAHMRMNQLKHIIFVIF